MKLITRDTDYAVRILCYLAGKKERVSVAQMVKELKFPRAFLRRITQRLSKAGMLTSVKGLRGGFVLSKAPGKIRLLDVMRIFQGRFILNDCLFKKKICPNRSVCFMRKQISDIQNYALGKFTALTIAGILKGGNADD